MHVSVTITVIWIGLSLESQIYVIASALNCMKTLREVIEQVSKNLKHSLKSQNWPTDTQTVSKRK